MGGKCVPKCPKTQYSGSCVKILPEQSAFAIFVFQSRRQMVMLPGYRRKLPVTILCRIHDMVVFSICPTWIWQIRQEMEIKYVLFGPVLVPCNKHVPTRLAFRSQVLHVAQFVHDKFPYVMRKYYTDSGALIPKIQSR